MSLNLEMTLTCFANVLPNATLVTCTKPRPFTVTRTPPLGVAVAGETAVTIGRAGAAAALDDSGIAPTVANALESSTIAVRRSMFRR